MPICRNCVWCNLPFPQQSYCSDNYRLNWWLHLAHVDLQCKWIKAKSLITHSRLRNTTACIHSQLLQSRDVVRFIKWQSQCIPGKLFCRSFRSHWGLIPVLTSVKQASSTEQVTSSMPSPWTAIRTKITRVIRCDKICRLILEFCGTEICYRILRGSSAGVWLTGCCVSVS